MVRTVLTGPKSDQKFLLPVNSVPFSVKRCLPIAVVKSRNIKFRILYTLRLRTAIYFTRLQRSAMSEIDFIKHRVQYARLFHVPSCVIIIGVYSFRPLAPAEEPRNT